MKKVIFFSVTLNCFIDRISIEHFDLYIVWFYIPIIQIQMSLIQIFFHNSFIFFISMTAYWPMHRVAPSLIVLLIAVMISSSKQCLEGALLFTSGSDKDKFFHNWCPPKLYQSLIVACFDLKNIYMVKVTFRCTN